MKTKPKRRVVWIGIGRGVVSVFHYASQEECKAHIEEFYDPGMKPTRFVEAPKARRKRG